VKRSGRDESVHAVIHMYMKAILGISLYNTLVHGSNARNLSIQLSLSQLAKTLCLSYYRLCLLFNKIGKEGRTVPVWKQGVVGEKWPKQSMQI
jgi:hypothetical protein